ADNEVRTYAGWNSTTGTPTGATQVTRDDYDNGYSETLTMTATPHLTNGVPDGSEAIANVQSLTRTFTNAAGQVIEEDDYFNLNGITYSTNPYLGTINVNYYATYYSYDTAGNQIRVQSPTGKITRTVYDGQGREVSTWIGTDDTPTSGTWSPSNEAGMIQLTSEIYDNGGMGDGNLTETVSYPGHNEAPQIIQYFYDWQDRQ